MEIREIPLRRALLLAALGVILCRKCQRPEPQQSAVTTKAAKSSPKKAAPPATPMLEPKAIDILKTACARLAAAHSMTFTAVVMFESPSLRTLIENGNPGSITVTGTHRNGARPPDCPERSFQTYQDEH